MGDRNGIGSAAVTYERRGEIGWIQLDDGSANVLNRASFAAWFAALDAAEADAAGAIVVAGNERFFSAGMDLKEMPTLGPAELNEAALDICRLGLRLFTFPRPVLAAVTGHAIAGGAIILLGCDRSVGTDAPVKIGLSEVAVGVPAGGFARDMATAHLSPRAHHGLLAGELYAPDRAYELGYLDEVVPHDRVIERATELAQTLAKLDDRAYKMTKQSMRGEAAARIEAQLAQDMSYVFASFSEQPG